MTTAPTAPSPPSDPRSTEREILRRELLALREHNLAEIAAGRSPVAARAAIVQIDAVLARLAQQEHGA